MRVKRLPSNIATVFEDDEFDGDKAYRRAAKGQSLLRPVKPGAKKPAPVVSSALTPVSIVEAGNVTSLVSDREHLWMGAGSMLIKRSFTSVSVIVTREEGKRWASASTAP